jgi:hypothetical protein
MRFSMIWHVSWSDKIRQAIEKEKQMRFLFYATENDGDGKRLQSMVENMFSTKNLEILHTIEDLESSLRVPLGKNSVAVLMATSVGELKEFIPLKNLMGNISLVLVVPDYEPETLELAHLLLPRYMEFKGNEFYFLSQVLGYLAG